MCVFSQKNEKRQSDITLVLFGWTAEKTEAP